MEEQKCDGLKKKKIIIVKRKVVTIDKSNTLDQPKKKKLRVVVKRKPEPNSEVVEVSDLEVSALNIARCLRRAKAIIKGSIDF